MKISARNVFDGNVEAIKPGAINSEVDVLLPGGLRIVATVTNDSVSELGLVAGKAVKALVKASSVLVLADGAGVRLSARNRLEGSVSALIEGPVSTEVAITLANGLNVYATITREGAAALGLKVGVAAAAVFKAPSVIIGVSS
ncbi:TOBE domain-containing protein [Zoogloea dura]|jgi:molybdate transport system regulatory protein|uniref:TOBE domain-containing protein n=1 Tax=Zoogloea dura TaxID=2728840 RepID=A0A848GA95_9RHOO|nr:TOBE domain-containing protein [Zoogloea dura]NML28429.1 TOBE domain-containing protein [Zoogloea dura]